MWRDVRAGLIAAAIAFGLIDGCPLPTPSHTPEWERGFVEPIRRVRDVVETPVAWIRGVFAVTQQFSLYQAPVAERYRMWIEGRRARSKTWELVYRAGDPDHAEDAALIEHARVWGEWDPTDTPALEYPQFTAWITARVLAAHPEFVGARVRMEKIVIGKGEVTASGTFEFSYDRLRSAP